MISRTFCPLLAALMIALCVPVAMARSVGNAADPNWTIHSSFYNQPRRICDSPSRTFFFVHSVPYNTQDYAKYFNHTSGAIFYLDKANPEAGLKDLAHEVPFTGFDMRLMDVNPQTGAMAVAYEDGGIDIVAPDGKLTYINALKEAHNYYMAIVTGLSFEPGSDNLFVCTKGGFICIDTASASVTVTADWRDAVNDVARLDDRYLAIINNGLYESTPGADISRRDSFKPIYGIASGTPLKLLPLANNTAAFATQEGAVNHIYLAPDKAWRRSTVISNSSIAKQPKFSLVNYLEHNIFHTPDGYVITSPSHIYFLTAGADDFSFNLNTVAAPPASTNFMGTADGSNFWFYQETGKFVKNTLSDSAWSGPSEPFRTAAPHTAKDVYFQYSPQYGFLAFSKHPGMKSSAVELGMPLTIASLRDNKWTDISPRARMPYFIEENPSIQGHWTNNTAYPSGPAYGMTIDPLHPEVLFSGNIWNGTAAVYLDDPRRKSHVHVVPNSTFIDYFGASSMFPASTWSPFAGVFIMGTDADNNIWATRSNLHPVDGSSQNLAQLWVLTPEARDQALENGTPESCGAWKHMEIDGGAFTEFYVMGQPLKHPKNKNKFLLSGQFNNGKGRPMRIYDTNGTLDDSSDDSFMDVNYFRRDDGSVSNTSNITSYFEDPSTGEVYLSAAADFFIVDLDSPVTANTMNVRSLSLTTEEGNKYGPFTGTQAFDIAQDEYGRLWIATSRFGVIGISPDRSKIVAHYCAENSPLPDNATYAVGWNPETQSLFISSKYIIAEVKVDAPADAASAQTGSTVPFIIPRSVTPEYAGTVAIHNVPVATSLRIRNSEGKTVAIINEVSNGVAAWNLKDADGKLVPAGTYTISDASGEPTFDPILLPVIR